MSHSTKPIRGTREWAVANIDCCTGCSHDCRYCYARFDAVERKKSVAAGKWSEVKVRQQDVEKIQSLYPGQVMFPTTHDIVPENLEACLTVIDNLLAAGNRVLVVTKPHLQCIESICERFDAYRRQLLFRFTITARKDSILNYWEPAAPGYSERKKSLCYAFEKGFQTSVSVEPMLDSPDVVDMVRELLPCITHSIWLGKMNNIGRRVRVEDDMDLEMIARIEAGQDDDVIFELYRQLRDEPLVRWKESIKNVVGLPLADAAGKDI